MAAFERATDSALYDPFMLGRVRSGVLPTNVGGIEELGGLPTGDLAAVVRAKTSRSSQAAHIVQEMLDVLGCIYFRPYPVNLLPSRSAVYEHDQEDGSVQDRLQRPAEDDVNPAERPRRADDSTSRRRSLRPLSFQAPNARQQGARQSNTLLLCGFPHQNSFTWPMEAWKNLISIFVGDFPFAKTAGLGARTAAA